MGSEYCKIRRNVARARALVVRATTAAGSGHPGGSFSMAEVLGCLFYKHMRYDPANPLWEGRDRLVLSKGHAAPGLFSHLAISGFMEESEMDTLRSLGSRLQGHPDLKCPGVEFCGGSLGTGLSYSIGIALALRLDRSRARVFAVVGDGESNEGQIWEATMSAAKFKLNNLVAVLDRNYIQQDSFTERVMPLDAAAPGKNPVAARTNRRFWRTADKWRAFGWYVIEVDGHRIEQLDAALSRAIAHRGGPAIIISRSVKGRGVEHMEDNPKWHGQAPSPRMVPVIMRELGSHTALAPSVIAGDMTRLDREVVRCREAQVDYIHMDVMDGVFVPETTFDHTKIRELRHMTKIPFDTHLMISEPVRKVRHYAEAGSDTVSVHAEACDASGFGEILDYLHSNGVGAGIAINPETPIPQWLDRFVPDLDQFIVMSVVPGRSGQSYIESSHQKTREVAAYLRDRGFGGVLEADGGVSESNLAQCFADGARLFVGGGSMVGQADMSRAVARMRSILDDARRLDLLREAHRLGGAEMVGDWADLHVADGAADHLREIAAGEGLT